MTDEMMNLRSLILRRARSGWPSAMALNRSWETGVGTVELHVPKLRKGSYFPGFLKPRRMAEKTLRYDAEGWRARRIDPLGGDLGACPSSPWSRGVGSDSLREHEQGLLSLEDR